MTKSLPNESATLLPKQGTKVSFPWAVRGVSSNTDEICWVIENIGLPGDRYITKLTENSIDYYFNDEKDAILVILSCK